MRRPRRPGVNPLTAPLPMPPDMLRVGPLRAGAFRSALHEPAVAAALGTALGVAFGTCFLTGLLSHYQQHPPAGIWWPTSPVWLYRVSQGLHVACGLASVPLLLAKLWTVYPKLFTWPPARNLAHAAERASVAVLVGSAVFQLATGVANIARWYPWHFGFTQTHFLVAWVAIGALLVHIGANVALARDSLRRPRPAPQAGPQSDGGVTRRSMLVGTAAAVGTVTVATVGQTLPGLSSVSALAPRLPGVGAQGLPVNRSATAARVRELATSGDFALALSGPSGSRVLTLAEVAAMRQRTHHLPISCVEGWSAGAVWTGVALRDLIALVGAPARSRVLVESLEPAGAYRTSVVDPWHTEDPRTMLASHVHGEPLHVDHGYPLRLISPNRPGVLQTKWVTAMRVL